MPVIRKSADLRNKYAEISAFCHKYREPVFITKNGDGDLAVMSIETYATLAGRNELYSLIQEGIDDVKNGKVFTENEVLKNMDKALGK
jgi:PHD/YefM family antitoxin component YafN of YafNO toxin-antitoxin module